MFLLNLWPIPGPHFASDRKGMISAMNHSPPPVLCKIVYSTTMSVFVFVHKMSCSLWNKNRWTRTQRKEPAASSWCPPHPHQTSSCADTQGNISSFVGGWDGKELFRKRKRRASCYQMQQQRKKMVAQESTQEESRCHIQKMVFVFR